MPHPRWKHSLGKGLPQRDETSPVAHFQSIPSYLVIVIVIVIVILFNIRYKPGSGVPLFLLASFGKNKETINKDFSFRTEGGKIFREREASSERFPRYGSDGTVVTVR